MGSTPGIYHPGTQYSSDTFTAISAGTGNTVKIEMFTGINMHVLEALVCMPARI